MAMGVVLRVSGWWLSYPAFGASLGLRLLLTIAVSGEGSHAANHIVVLVTLDFS